MQTKLREMEYCSITNPSKMIEIEELERLIWGENNVVPVGQLMAAVHNGGVVIAAYHDEKPIGFCYGFAGFKQDKLHLCSHMLGILPEYRDWGIGKQLKLRQREWALVNGYNKMTWTYDPLESRNAYLNLNKLGGTVKNYMRSYYGDMNDSINKGLPSDRFLLEWDLDSDRTVQALDSGLNEPSKWRMYPRLLDYETFNQHPRPVIHQTIADHRGILLSVPVSIHTMKKDRIELALDWRLAMRQQFEEAFLHGFVVVGLLKNEVGPVHDYVLERHGMGQG